MVQIDLGYVMLPWPHICAGRCLAHHRAGHACRIIEGMRDIAALPLGNFAEVEQFGPHVPYRTVLDQSPSADCERIRLVRVGYYIQRHEFVGSLCVMQCLGVDASSRN